MVKTQIKLSFSNLLSKPKPTKPPKPTTKIISDPTNLQHLHNINFNSENISETLLNTTNQELHPSHTDNSTRSSLINSKLKINDIQSISSSGQIIVKNSTGQSGAQNLAPLATSNLPHPANSANKSNLQTPKSDVSLSVITSNLESKMTETTILPKEQNSGLKSPWRRFRKHHKSGEQSSQTPIIINNLLSSTHIPHESSKISSQNHHAQNYNFNKYHPASSDFHTSSKNLSSTQNFSQKKKVFGCPLSQCEMSANFPHVPKFIVLCCSNIENSGMDQQGIYRVPGNDSLKKKLIEELNESGLINATDTRFNDTNLCASLLKEFLRDLPDCLITDLEYKNFIKISKIINDSERILATKQQLKILPSHNFATLAYLCSHLNKLSLRVQYNKMTVENLATIFAPSVFSGKNQSQQKFLEDIKDINQHYKLLKDMIVNFKFYFFEEAEQQRLEQQGSQDQVNPSADPVPASTTSHTPLTETMPEYSTSNSILEDKSNDISFNYTSVSVTTENGSKTPNSLDFLTDSSNPNHHPQKLNGAQNQLKNYTTRELLSEPLQEDSLNLLLEQCKKLEDSQNKSANSLENLGKPPKGSNTLKHGYSDKSERSSKINNINVKNIFKRISSPSSDKKLVWKERTKEIIGVRQVLKFRICVLATGQEKSGETGFLAGFLVGFLTGL